MTEERITETETPSGNVHTTHTVVTDEGRSGGSGWLIAIVILIAAVAAIYLFSQQSNSETAKDNAVAEAAQDVGNAAKSVGDAAKDAVDGK